MGTGDWFFNQTSTGDQFYDLDVKVTEQGEKSGTKI